MVIEVVLSEFPPRLLFAIYAVSVSVWCDITSNGRFGLPMPLPLNLCHLTVNRGKTL